MALATAAPDGRPSVRMVLMKQADEAGIVFFTHVPEAWELWQHRECRLHDRFRYRRGRPDWAIERLGP